MAELPAPSEGDYLGYDASGNPWLLWWEVPHTKGVWTAFGRDDRGYPCVRVLEGDHADLIVRWIELTD